jgi:hypothetical protein
MNKERLQLVRDAVAKSGRTHFDLGMYCRCVFGYCASLPEFNAIGLENNARWETITFQNSLGDTVVGKQAVLAFLEVDGVDSENAIAFTYAETYDEYKRRGALDIPTESILAKIDAQLAELA